MKTLLIWEEIPEKTRFFALTDLTQTDYEALSSAHGKIINCDDENEGMTFLNAALTPDIKKEKYGVDLSYPDWSRFEIEIEALSNSGPFDRVFWSGFAL